MSFLPKIQNENKDKSFIYDGISINNILLNTLYILPLTNESPKPISNGLYIDYVNLRRIIDHVNVDDIVNYFIELVTEILNEYEAFDIHINLKSFTISSLEKYKNLVCMFYNKHKMDYISHINAVYIYYTPHVFETIKSIFVKLGSFSNNHVVPVLYSHKESHVKLTELLNK